MIRVPLLDLTAQYASIRDEVRAAIDRVCDSQHFILGPEVQALEEELAAFCGARHAVGVSSGTDALLVALMALGLRPGDEVVIPAYSFFATAGVVSRLGATPVFADIDPATFNLDPARLPALLTARTRAVMPVHLYGRSAELAPLERETAARGIALIEDAAQAIGSQDAKGRRAGAIGTMGCFSFFPTKNLGGFGDGGLVTTDDPALAESLRTLRIHGMKPKYHHPVVGGNFRLDALQAAILRVKLKRLPDWTAARRRNADRYRRLFAAAGVGDPVVLPADDPGHVYNQFVIRARNRDGLQAFLSREGVGTEIYYPVPLHLQECFRNLGRRPGDFPASEQAAKESLALPIYPELEEGQQRYVAERIAAFYRS